MRKISTSVNIPIVFVLALLSGSCRKAIDYYKKFHETDYKDCQISRVSVHFTDEQGTSTVIYTFSYNTAGDPVTVKNTAVATGNPNTVLKYDKTGRLKEMIRPYENGTFETWTRYSYNGSGQIISDTQYVFGTYVDSMPVAHPETDGYWVSQFNYDTLSRINARTDSVFNPHSAQFGANYSFQYDANGNLVDQGVTYDARLSLLRTNKIWMFLCNNYSLGNGFQASAYNTHDFPLSFPGSYETMGPVVSLSGDFDVQYSCNED